jgi:hypothetical protein
VEQNERIISHTLTRGCARKLEDVDFQEDERVVDESYASRNGFTTVIDSLTKQTTHLTPLCSEVNSYEEVL